MELKKKKYIYIVYLLITLWVIFRGPQNPFASLVKKVDDIITDDFRIQKTQPATSFTSHGNRTEWYPLCNKKNQMIGNYIKQK